MKSNQQEKQLPSYDRISIVSLPAQLVPISQTLSDEAANWLSDTYETLYLRNDKEGSAKLSVGHILEAISSVRRNLELRQKVLLESANLELTESVIGGIPVHIITPESIEKSMDGNKLVLFLGDSKNFLGLQLYASACHLALKLNTKVITPKTPTHVFQSSAEKLASLLPLYEELLKEYPACNIALLGESSGAVLCASLLILAFQNGLESVAVLGLLGIDGLLGDSNYHNKYLDSTNMALLAKAFLDEGSSHPDAYQDNPSSDDPVMSPINANMEIFPPTILFAGTRDIGFSTSVIYHRELRRAGVEAKLHVFDGLPRAYHLQSELPESQETYDNLADFFRSKLGRVTDHG